MQAAEGEESLGFHELSRTVVGASDSSFVRGPGAAPPSFVKLFCAQNVEFGAPQGSPSAPPFPPLAISYSWEEHLNYEHIGGGGNNGKQRKTGGREGRFCVYRARKLSVPDRKNQLIRHLRSPES